VFSSKAALPRAAFGVSGPCIEISTIAAMSLICPP